MWIYEIITNSFLDMQHTVIHAKEDVVLSIYQKEKPIRGLD